ncbi:MAG: peptidoglycan DD-metalloendopeptidase family protein [Elusimicrobia bacterium]|nr:peptidoglycan DD-metalloendopeptidase family protein [Elusimicrobiota bacterium]
MFFQKNNKKKIIGLKRQTENQFMKVLAGIIYFSIIAFSCICYTYADNYDKQIKEYKQKIKKSKKELTGVKTEISKKEDNVKIIKKKEASIESQLENILRNLESTKIELQKTKILIAQQQKSIDGLKIKLEITKKEMIKWKDTLRNEIRFAYIQGVGRPVTDEYSARILLSSNSSADLVKRYKFLQLLARQKSFVYLQTAKNVNKYESLKIKLESGMEELKNLELKKGISEQTYSRQKNDKKQLLSTVVKKRIFYEQEIGSLRDSETMLSELIDLLEKKAKETEKQKEEERLSRIKMSKKKGLISWPIEGETSDLRKNVSSIFGKQKHPELDTWVINNGIRIKSILGQNIIAIDKGKVVFAGEFKSYGKMVIIDHLGGFYSIYGNLDKIMVKEEQEIQKGEVIGIVGISVYTQDASLYFELRRDGVPQDPLSWLK